ncbi:hypothetical protein ABK040_002228 [Willaertia magna]
MEFLILGGVVFVSSVLGGTYYSCVYKPISTDEVALPAGSSTTTTTNNITLGDDGLSDENASALLLPPKTKKKMDECQLVNNEKLELLKKKGASSSRNGTFGSIFGKSNKCIEEEDDDIEGKGYIEIPEYATSSILTRLSLQQTSHTTSLKTLSPINFSSQHTIQQEEEEQQKQEEEEETTEVVDIEKFLKKEREKNFEQVLMEKHPYHIAESFGNDARKNYSPPVAFIQNSKRSNTGNNNSTSTIH